MRSVCFHCVVVLLLIVHTPVQADNEPGQILQQDLGRNYGLMVGDMIHHSYVIEVDSSYSLTQSSLPVPGHLNYWLELRDVEFSSTERGNKNLYRLSLTYQSFYAPLDIRRLLIPSVQLDFSNEEQQKYRIELDEWAFTMSPIKEIALSGVAAGNQNELSNFMKPAIAPKLSMLRPLQDNMVLYAALFTVTSLLLLVISGWIPSLTRSPFIKAQKKIKRLRKKHSGELQSSQACLQAVHEAINQRAGHTIFASQLDKFLTKQPQFDSLRTQLAQFYQTSQDCFFLDKPIPSDIIDDCIKLCGQLANADKVSVSS